MKDFKVWQWDPEVACFEPEPYEIQAISAPHACMAVAKQLGIAPDIHNLVARLANQAAPGPIKERR